jgi:hypothetical protein
MWTLVAFVTDTLHAYWRTLGHFTLLENIRIVFFQGALIYWAIAFWRPESKIIAMPADAKIDLDNLAVRIEYAQPRRASSGDIPK